MKILCSNFYRHPITTLVDVVGKALRSLGIFLGNRTSTGRAVLDRGSGWGGLRDESEGTEGAESLEEHCRGGFGTTMGVELL